MAHLSVFDEFSHHQGRIQIYRLYCNCYFEPLSLILNVQNTQHNIVLQIINNNKVSDTMVDVNC